MPIKYKLEKKVPRKGFPTSNKEYHEAHSEADAREKKKYPKGYKTVAKNDKKTPYTELLGTNTPSGKIIVSARVPKANREEIAYHEQVESKAIKRLHAEHAGDFHKHNLKIKKK
jgi:hypothetical protein